jgi:hypothetical protein
VLVVASWAGLCVASRKATGQLMYDDYSLCVSVEPPDVALQQYADACELWIRDIDSVTVAC